MKYWSPHSRIADSRGPGQAVLVCLCWSDPIQVSAACVTSAANGLVIKLSKKRAEPGRELSGAEGKEPNDPVFDRTGAGVCCERSPPGWRGQRTGEVSLWWVRMEEVSRRQVAAEGCGVSAGMQEQSELSLAWLVSGGSRGITGKSLSLCRSDFVSLWAGTRVLLYLFLALMSAVGSSLDRALLCDGISVPVQPGAAGVPAAYSQTLSYTFALGHVPSGCCE